MKVVITAATQMEWMPASQTINPAHTNGSDGIAVSFHASGVGLLVSAVSLAQLVLQQKPDLIIQAGIAGCFDETAQLGSVVAIRDEALGDTGVQEGGVWKDLFDLNLAKPDGTPFKNGGLPNPGFDRLNLLNLTPATGVTVNEITTRPERIAIIKEKYNPFIESMEGAALHYVCGQFGVPFIQIRAISNYIGERNKANWKIKDAITNLNAVILQYVEKAASFGL